jgi:hypothetical protein
VVTGGINQVQSKKAEPKPKRRKLQSLRVATAKRKAAYQSSPTPAAPRAGPNSDLHLTWLAVPSSSSLSSLLVHFSFCVHQFLHRHKSVVDSTCESSLTCRQQSDWTWPHRKPSNPPRLVIRLLFVTCSPAPATPPCSQPYRPARLLHHHLDSLRPLPCSPHSRVSALVIRDVFVDLTFGILLFRL